MNSSRSPLLAEFMRCLPLDEAPPGYRAELERACTALDAKITLPKDRKTPLLLSPVQRREILAEYTPGNRALAKRYFSRDELFLDPLPPLDAPVANLALPEDSYVTMEQLVAPFLRELIRLNKAKDDTDRS